MKNSPEIGEEVFSRFLVLDQYKYENKGFDSFAKTQYGRENMDSLKINNDLSVDISTLRRIHCQVSSLCIDVQHHAANCHFHL